MDPGSAKNTKPDIIFTTETTAVFNKIKRLGIKILTPIYQGYNKNAIILVNKAILNLRY